MGLHKREIANRVREEKKRAAENRKLQEEEYMMQVQTQYHVERKTKKEEIKFHETELKTLQDEEDHLMHKLQTTLRQEESCKNNLKTKMEEKKFKKCHHMEEHHHHHQHEEHHKTEVDMVRVKKNHKMLSHTTPYKNVKHATHTEK